MFGDGYSVVTSSSLQMPKSSESRTQPVLYIALLIVPLVKCWLGILCAKTGTTYTTSTYTVAKFIAELFFFLVYI